MMALPVAGLAVVRRWTGSPAQPALVGAVAFVGSQVVHVPLNLVVGRFGPPLPDEVRPWLVPLALGISAGLCEETARWWALRRNRSAAGAAVTGLGHGGVEAALLGLAVMVTAVRLLAVGDGTGLPEEAQSQIRAVWTSSDLLALVAVGERVFAMCAHLAASMLVGLAVVRRSVWPWLGALALHAGLDAGAVALAPSGPVVTEGFVGGVALLGLVVVAAVARVWPADAPSVGRPPPPRDAGSLSRRPLSAADAADDGIV